MKRIITTAAIAAVIGALLLVAVPVQAGIAGFPSHTPGQSGERGDRITGQLDRLEEAGYDVSAIRAAVESGETEKARTLMQEFMKQHKDEFPALAGKGEKSNRITGQLDRLEEAGYDVSAIRAAVESGETEKARTLMQEFIKQHKDEFPAPPCREHKGMGGMREIPAQSA